MGNSPALCDNKKLTPTNFHGYPLPSQGRLVGVGGEGGT